MSVYGKKRTRQREKYKDIQRHFAISEYISQMFYPFDTDFSATEIKCRECLCETNEHVDDRNIEN